MDVSCTGNRNTFYVQ